MTTSLLRTLALLALALVASAAVSVPVTTPAAHAQDRPDIYVVRSGDTLFRIARAFRLSPEQIRVYNSLTSDAIRVGQRLVLRPGLDATLSEGVVVNEPPQPGAQELTGLRPMTSTQPPRETPPRETPPRETPPRETPRETAPPRADPPAGSTTTPTQPSASGTSQGGTAEIGTFTPPPREPFPDRDENGLRPNGDFLAGPSPYRPRPPEPPPPSAHQPVPIPVDFVASAPPSTVGPVRTHTVQAGETLFRIALTYDTTVDALRRLNGIQTDEIAVGQVLRVGGGGASPAASTAPRRFRVDRTAIPADRVLFAREGETLYSAAARYRLSVADLLAQSRHTTAPILQGYAIVLPDEMPLDYRNPDTSAVPAPDTSGLALVYPDTFAGRTLASGRTYDPSALMVSHRTLPFGAVVLLRNAATGRVTFATVQDRGPISEGYLVELSRATAEALGVDARQAQRIDLKVVR